MDEVEGQFVIAPTHLTSHQLALADGAGPPHCKVYISRAGCSTKSWHFFLEQMANVLFIVQH